MHIKDLYSIVVTERRAECRDFYIRWFGFRVVFEESWFVYLAASDDHPFGVAFMTPGSSFPASRSRCVQRERAAAYPSEPWGQRRFAVYDPSGTWVDVIQQIDPAPGFWEKYLP